MPCYSPITAYRARHPNKSGKYPLVFNAQKGYVDRKVQVPCGKCIGCRLEYSRQWAVRCVHEAQLHDESAFITLTYAPEHLPENRSISKEAVQKFMKRLRKKIECQVRYFACGEYGEDKGRPHYHALIFGYSFPDKVPFKQNARGEMLYTSDELAQVWPFGFNLIGPVTVESAAYVARYVVKKMKHPDPEVVAENYRYVDSETGEVHERTPEFCLMSRRPGLGAGWLEKYKKDTDKDFVTIDGVKHGLNRFYDARLEAAGEDMQRRKAKRAAAIVKADQTPERLLAREKCRERKIERLKRMTE